MSKSKIQIQDSDIANGIVALRRAAKKARKIAEETRTPLIVYENGRMIKTYPWKEKGKKAAK